MQVEADAREALGVPDLPVKIHKIIRWSVEAVLASKFPAGHAQGMPPQADHDACGGGELGYPDEPVAGPWDTEVRGGLPHLGLAGQLADRGEQTGRSQQQRDDDERGNLLARLGLRPSSGPLTWSFPLGLYDLSALTWEPAVTLADRRHPLRRSSGSPPNRPCHSEVAGQGTVCRLWRGCSRRHASGKLGTSVMSKSPGPRSPSGRPAAGRRAPGGLATEPVPDTRARHWTGRTRAGAAAGSGALPPPPRDPGAR